MDLASADLLWTFFVSASESYRRDSVLRPFPTGYLNSQGEKDFERLTSVLRQCPPLRIVNERGRGEQTELLKLMRWVLNPKRFNLKQLAREKFQEIFSRVTAVSDRGFEQIPKPDFIFELVPSEAQDERFRRLQGDMKLLHGFHGSKVENFYSILNYGLRNNLNKVSLYGEGIYLSSDLAVAMNYGPTGQGWQHSIFGQAISCLAVCEMIDHPDVKCSIKSNAESQATAVSNDLPLDGNVRKDSTTCFTSTHSSGNSTRCRSRIQGSEGGEIPEKYFVVRNDELVRVKYLLLYCRSGGQLNDSKCKDKISIFGKHRFFIVMLLYVFILLVASFCNSRVKEWWKSL